MDGIKDIVYGVMEDWAAKKEGAQTDSPPVWLKKVLTKRELAHIKFNYFRKGILGIWVDSSGWLYVLNLKKTQLLEKLGQTSNRVKDIRFKIGVVR